MSRSLQNLTIKQGHELLVSKQITARELVEYYLDNIKKQKDLNICLSVCEQEAKAQAADIDAKLANGEKIGLLEGIPYTAKDMFLTKVTRTTAASQILDNYIAPYSATVIEKLDASGAILLAKVNQDEFAHGGSTENSSYGPTKNPRDESKVPGGSSGGSAAAVAADIGVFSLGTDTGGSIRQPASFCGVVGLKPTYGLVSRYGVVAMASSLDVIGPLTRTVEDSAIVLGVIAGLDPKDSTTIEMADNDYVKAAGAKKKFKLGLIREYVDGLDAKNRAALERATKQLQAFGHSVTEVDMPYIEYSLPCYYIIAPSEISSNLERYDGIRYGASSPDAADLFEVYNQTRGRNLGPEVKRRVLTGTYALSAGYYDAYYKKAMQVRTLIKKDFDQAFAKFDLLIGPTTPTPAFALGANTDNPINMYLSDIMTVGANLAGVTAISLPNGLVDDLPVGLQIIAPQKGEPELFALASDFEAASSEVGA